MLYFVCQYISTSLSKYCKVSLLPSPSESLGALRRAWKTLQWREDVAQPSGHHCHLGSKSNRMSRLVKEWNSQVGTTTTPSLPTPQLCLSPKSRLFLCLVFIHERICYIPPSPLWWTWCPSLSIRPITISKSVTKLYRSLASQDNNHKWKKLVAKRTGIHHLFHFQREGTSTPTRSKVWDGRQDLGRELRLWGFIWNLSPFVTPNILPRWSIMTSPPQVRIFGVTLMVSAWWLDAAAKGIPPTIPLVNFNTVFAIINHTYPQITTINHAYPQITTINHFYPKIPTIFHNP